MKKTLYLLLALLLGACQNEVDPNAELSALIGGQAWAARPTATRRSTIHLNIEGYQGDKSYLAIGITGGTALFRPFTAEWAAGGMEVLNPALMQGQGSSPDSYWAYIVYYDAEKGESWMSMRPAEGSAGQLVVTKADREELVGEFSGTLWGPIRRDSDAWKDPRNLRPLKVERGVVRVRAKLAD